MKWVNDTSGKLIKRPHFKPEELDRLCENALVEFLIDKYGKPNFPISTGDLEQFLESETSDFDPYADLSSEGRNVEGMTVFLKGKKPTAKISEHLSRLRSDNRRRSTIAHELGHVLIHAGLWGQRELLVEEADYYSKKCLRKNIINAPVSDWMEWQAGYSSGALLMPKSFVGEIASKVHSLVKSDAPIKIVSSSGAGLIQRTKRAFSVSNIATKVRLLQLGYLLNE